MVKRIMFRIDTTMEKEIDRVMAELMKQGLDLDYSKVLRYVINKGLERLSYEGLIDRSEASNHSEGGK